MKVLSVFTTFLALFNVVRCFPFEEVRVLQLNDFDIITVKESEKFSLVRRGIKFIDITKHLEIFPFSQKAKKDPEVAKYTYPEEITQRALAEPLLNDIDHDDMHKHLAKFTSFYTRYYKSETGFQAAEWLSERINSIVSILPRDMVSVEHVDHKDWKQYSIILKIKGTETPENIVVVGSHLDSMNLMFPSLLPAPGADDNGSGTVTNLEALRLIVQHIQGTGHAFKNTIEFHFYSAEEGGLLGSLDVFVDYAKKEKKVVAMLQQDMTGYVQDESDEHVGIITDYTTPSLTNFIKKVAENYLSIPYKETSCGYACSDHGSAIKNGFPASFVIESQFNVTNKYIHSTMDTLDRLSFKHMGEHVKLVIGAVLELGDWSHFDF